MALDPQLQGTLAARIKYFRDLGIFDFYRRGEPSPAEEAIVASPTVTVTDTYISTTRFAENPPEMPRAVSPIPTTIPLISGPAPIAPELRAAALQAIREEIGDCQRCPSRPPATS